jgi:hypothetical protein
VRSACRTPASGAGSHPATLADLFAIPPAERFHEIIDGELRAAEAAPVHALAVALDGTTVRVAAGEAGLRGPCH